MRSSRIVVGALLSLAGLVAIWGCSGWLYAEMDRVDAVRGVGSLLHPSTAVTVGGALAFIAGLVVLAVVARPRSRA